MACLGCKGNNKTCLIIWLLITFLVFFPSHFLKLIPESLQISRCQAVKFQVSQRPCRLAGKFSAAPIRSKSLKGASRSQLAWGFWNFLADVMNRKDLCLCKTCSLALCCLSLECRLSGKARGAGMSTGRKRYLHVTRLGSATEGAWTHSRSITDNSTMPCQGPGRHLTAPRTDFSHVAS